MLGAHLTLREYLDACQRLVRKLDPSPVTDLADEIAAAAERGSRLILADARGRLAPDFSSRLARPPFEPLVSGDPLTRPEVHRLSRTEHGCAGPDGRNPREELERLARREDLLLVFGAGAAGREYRDAVGWAARHALGTWALTGYDGDVFRGLSRRLLTVPIGDPALVESVHGLLLAWIADDVLARLDRVGRYAFHAPASSRRP